MNNALLVRPARAAWLDDVAQAPRNQRGAVFLKAVLRGCLDDIRPHADAIAKGRVDDEAIHQLRVGLRRLRTALRELGPLDQSTDLSSHEPSLAAVFRALGDVRDRQTVIAQLTPKLQAAGIGAVPWRTDEEAPEPAQAVRDAAFRGTLDALQAYSDEPAGPGGASSPSLRRFVRDRLRKLHRRVKADARRFRSQSEATQHRTRKRLKRLRYLTEFTRGLFRDKFAEAYLRRMRPAQDALGHHNDLAVAMSLIDPHALAAGDPQAKAAAAWLGRQGKRSTRRGERSLQRLRGGRRLRRSRP